MLTDSQIQEIIDNAHEEAVVWDGFDQALIGTDIGGRLVYSIERMEKVLMDRDGMTKEDAKEFLDFNTFGTNAGDFTPLHVYLYI